MIWSISGAEISLDDSIISLINLVTDQKSWSKILIIFSVAAYMVSNNSYSFNTTAYLYHIIILIYFDPDQSK